MRKGVMEEKMEGKTVMKKAEKTDRSDDKDPGSKGSKIIGDKKMLVAVMNSDMSGSIALCKVLDENGFDGYICNDLSSALQLIRNGTPFGFALIAPTMKGRDGYMKMLRVFCEEQHIPLEVIDENTIEKIRRFGVHFPQQIVH